MNEVREIESYIQGRLGDGDRLLMDAKLIINTELREKFFWQQKTYELIKEYSRQKLKHEIEQIHIQLFSENKFMSFRQKIKNIFK